MSRQDYNSYRGWALPADEEPTDQGYLLENPKGVSNHANHKGYVSWLPYREFEADHTLVEGAEGKPAHEQRVLAELSELQKKLKALVEFTKTDKYLLLPFTDRNHLQEQCRVMTSYVFVLEARIARFK